MGAIDYLLRRMNAKGKTREQIEFVLAKKSRTELLDLIFSLVTVEQLFKPSEIAARSCVNKRTVLRDIRDGKFGDYFVRAENSIAVPASGVNAWRDSFRVPPKQLNLNRSNKWWGIRYQKPLFDSKVALPRRKVALFFDFLLELYGIARKRDRPKPRDWDESPRQLTNPVTTIFNPGKRRVDFHEGIGLLRQKTEDEIAVARIAPGVAAVGRKCRTVDLRESSLPRRAIDRTDERVA